MNMCWRFLFYTGILY